jgi:DNA-binding GntR family transcriptional regulator
MGTSLIVGARRLARFAERKSLGQEVAALIKQAIAEGALAPGERIVESKLAQELGLSLTPVREAVRELVGEGILTVSPNRGPSVRVLSPEDAFELYSLRAMLEGLSIRLAIARASVEERAAVQHILDEMVAAVADDAIPTLLPYSTRIHEGIVALSTHARLIAFYQSLALQIALLNRVVSPTSNKEHEVAWHRPVVTALIGDDPDRAERVIRTHIYESYQAYMAASGAGRALSDQGGQV